MPIVKTPARPMLSTQRRRVVRKIATMRAEAEDLLDSLELLEARAKDNGVRYSVDEVRAKLRLPQLKR
jgi:hypothetical protein